MRTFLINRFLNYSLRFIKLIIKLKFREAFFKVYGTLHFILFINPNYKKWILKNEPKSDLIRHHSISLAAYHYLPLISIITPVYRIPPEVLEETIRSVISQTYTNWQLCLSDCDLNGNNIHSMISHYVKTDPRISSILLEDNLMISGNSNEAKKLCNGDFIALLDHDDLLAPFALFRVVQVLNNNKDIDFIYSDRDLLISNDFNQYRINPFFKPGWSPEILFSANYLTHFCVISRAIFSEIGDFDSNTDGAQDWDLFLRVIDKTNRIHHIPEILYHWRQLPSSMSYNPHSKPYAAKAQIRAVDNHLRRNGIKAHPEIGSSGFIKLRWNGFNAKSSISIIIRDWSIQNDRALLINLLKQLTSENIIEIILICDEQLERNENYEDISSKMNVKIVIKNQRMNSIAQINSIVKLLKGDFVLFLNPYVNIVTKDFLCEMVNWLLQKDIGIVSGQVIAKNNKIWNAGIVLGPKGEVVNVFRGSYPGEFGIFGSTEWYRNYNAVAGDCMMIRRELFNLLGGFNEFLPDEESPIEFCLRIRERGYRILVTPYAKFKRSVPFDSNQKLPNLSASTLDLWKSLSPQGDQYFNRNLSYYSTKPQFGQPGK